MYNTVEGRERRGLVRGLHALRQCADLSADPSLSQAGAVSGTIRDGDELPSRRVLSALLGVNPNTVQKHTGCWRRKGS